AKSLTAPKTPWVGNTVRLGSLRWVVQSNYRARSSRRLVRIEVEWSSIHSRMYYFSGRLLNHMPARRTRLCCRRPWWFRRSARSSGRLPRRKNKARGFAPLLAEPSPVREHRGVPVIRAIQTRHARRDGSLPRGTKFNGGFP